MKLSRQLTWVGLFVAVTGWGQTEQWLTYHTSSEGRAYHQLQLTTNPPANVALPSLKASPYFARWTTPLDPTGGRWLCLDRSRKSGPYDLLYIDKNGNGRLDDEKAIQARVESENAMFSATPVVFKGEDGPVTYHLAFRFYQYDKNAAQLLASSAGWYEGTVNFDGAKKRVQVIDGNVNGTFNDMAAAPYDSDRVQVDGDKAGERFLGRMLEVDGKFYNVEVARDGACIKVQKAANVTLGPVRVPEDISEFVAFGENGHFIRKPAGGELTMPVGEYRVVRWRIDRKDDKGAAWTLSGYNFPKTAAFEVTTEKGSVLAIGEPVEAKLEATNITSRQIRFDLRFLGPQKESVELLRGNERPRGPKLMLANADGSLCYTNTFEFG